MPKNWIVYQETLTYRVGHAEKLNAILKTLTYRLGHAEKLNAILKNFNL